jgi:cobalt-zinc-cadmium efflux system membrane fusion protein
MPPELPDRSDDDVMDDQPGEPVDPPAPDSGPPGRPRRRRRHLVAGAIVLIALLGALIYWRYRSTHQAPPAIGVEEVPPNVVFANEHQLKNLTIEPVAARDFTVDREVTGRVGFNEDRLTPVFPAYSGRVVEALATKGQFVSRGQPLLVIESPDYVEAQNNLAVARGDLDRAAVNLQTAQVSAERARRLFTYDAISKKDLQSSEAALALAFGELQRSRGALRVAQARLELFGKTAGAVRRLKAGADRRITIDSPISGTVVERQVGPGQVVKPDAQTPLFQISDLSDLWVHGDVFESDLARIRLGAPAKISVESYPNRVFPARVSFINPAVDPVTRTVHVRCRVSNPRGLLKPEMFARMTIVAAAEQSVPVIPAGAVVGSGEVSFVLVEEAPGRFRKRKVEIGHEVDGSVMIKSGLKVGERIVTKGAVLLIR